MAFVAEHRGFGEFHRYLKLLKSLESDFKVFLVDITIFGRSSRVIKKNAKNDSESQTVPRRHSSIVRVK